METAVATAFLTKIAPKLFAFLQEKHKRRQSLERDIQYIRKEFRMIAAAIQDHDRRRGLQRSDGDDVQRVWIQLVRDLAYSIEDCVDRFTHRVRLPPPPKPDGSTPSWLRKTVHGVKTATTRSKFATAVRELRKISEEASKLRACYIGSGGGGGCQSSTSGLSASSSTFFSSCETTTHTIAADLVGMDVPRDEVLQLMRETQGQPKQLKVISIVGFGGLGKTLLAREVYDESGDGQYEPRAWVRAAERGAGDVLKEILHELGMQVPDGGDINKLSTSIRGCLGSKRFFIVIDDMRKEFWNIIKNAFPAVSGVSSRVVVTTAVHSIANACSSFAHGHVYMMRTLDEENSRRLFFKQASLDDPPPDAGLGSEALKKSDGLPLALVTVAQFLQSRGNPTRTEWAKLCNNLGELLETKDTLARMNRVLADSYSSLTDHVLKACLLYMGIFPGGRPVRTESLLRRLLAEGFVEECGVANDRFKELVDRSIVLPVAVNNNTELKTCQTHGMMLEFILRKSVQESFVTLLHGQDRPPGDGKIRWLSLNHYSGNPSNDLSHVRSLTVFGKAHKSVLEFSKYELLRVLDLEECDDYLDDKHLLEICNLLLLRYLSLRGNKTITVLPKEISKLKYLETLDLTRTKIEVLPIQVLKMTSLIHLFGAFKLEDVGRKVSKLQAFLSEKSKLETLKGFVADESQIFAQLLQHMEHLTKVKIRWVPTVDGSSNLNHLSDAIQGFIERSTNMNDAHSLSLGSTEWPQDLLNFSLENSCYLHSLKLHGNSICSLPPFVTMLGGLTELCLSSPNNQLSGDILASVSTVRCLHYLKLTANQLGSLEIENGVLGSLRGLCVVVQSMAGLDIKKGALQRLESLRLLCKDLDGRVLCGINMECLRQLKEVALHDGVSDGAKQDWKEAAKKHPKQPKVLFMQTMEDVDWMQMGSSNENSESCAAPTPMSEDDVQTQVGSVMQKSPAGTIARLIHGSKRTNNHLGHHLCEFDNQSKQELEAAASKQPKRPKVLFVGTVEDVDVTMQMEHSAATATVAVADVQMRPSEGREHSIAGKIAGLTRHFKRRRFL